MSVDPTAPEWVQNIQQTGDDINQRINSYVPPARHNHEAAEAALVGVAAYGAARAYSSYQVNQRYTALAQQVQQEGINTLGPDAYTPQGQYLINQYYQEQAVKLTAQIAAESKAHSKKAAFWIIGGIIFLILFTLWGGM